LILTTLVLGFKMENVRELIFVLNLFS